MESTVRSGASGEFITHLAAPQFSAALRTGGVLCLSSRSLSCWRTARNPRRSHTHRAAPRSSTNTRVVHPTF